MADNSEEKREREMFKYKEIVLNLRDMQDDFDDNAHGLKDCPLVKDILIGMVEKLAQKYDLRFVLEFTTYVVEHFKLETL